MHYKGHVITKELPSEELLNKILDKYYYEDEENKSGFTWDWWQIGGRYGGKIKIHFNPSENEDKLWCKRNRNGKYFISNILSKIMENNIFYDELDFMLYMGLYEKTLYVDGGYSKDFIDFDITDCYVVIDENNYINVRQKWNGEDWIKNEKFDDEVKQIDLTGKFITIIDFHD